MFELHDALLGPVQVQGLAAVRPAFHWKRRPQPLDAVGVQIVAADRLGERKAAEGDELRAMQGHQPIEGRGDHLDAFQRAARRPVVELALLRVQTPLARPVQVP